MNPYLSVFCVYICISICSSEKLKSDKMTDKFDKTKGTSNYRRPTYKTKEDIPPEYLDELKKRYKISEDPLGDKEREEKRRREELGYTDDSYIDDDYGTFTTELDEAAQSNIYITRNDDADWKEDLTANNTETNGTCEICEMRENEKRMRLEQIKSTILNKLGFSSNNLPNVTRKTIPSIPAIKRIIEAQEMQGDAPYASDEFLPEDELYGQVKRAYTIAQTSKFCFNFFFSNASKH